MKAARGRPLRSLLVGDCDRYMSPLVFGVAQGMSRLGHWHSQVSVRQPVDVIARRLQEVRPDVVWCHMTLWPPEGAPTAGELAELLEREARRGARALLHDGDYKKATRHPRSIASWCALALCNHGHDRSAWGVPVLRWPYFAFDQERPAEPSADLACDLFFAGQLGDGPVYAARTALVRSLRAAGVSVRTPAPGENTLLRTAEVAASAKAVLGFGRPGSRGWTDTRVFQYPGAGGVLVHDDVGGYLEPWVHYAPYESGSAESVAEALGRLDAAGEPARRAMRDRAFAYVQRWHSSTARVREALEAAGLRGDA